MYYFCSSFMNTIGKYLRFTSFGESHGRAIGGVLDGVRAGVKINLDMIKQELDRRVYIRLPLGECCCRKNKALTPA